MRYLTILLLLFVSSENIEYKKLTDGFTKVPADENYFTKNYRDDYNVALPAGIEANTLYIPCYIIAAGVKTETPKWPDYFSMGYMFYNNGCVNMFRRTPEYHRMTLDPQYQGYRGVSFNKNGKKNFIEVYSPINKDREMVIKKYKLKVEGDTLYMKETKGGFIYDYVFAKNKTGIKTQYTANW